MQLQTGAVLATLTTILALLATYTDIRWRRVFNWITLPGVVLGLALNTATRGVPGLVLSLEGLGVGIGLLLFVAFLGKAMGGGDIKLLMAIGALQGPTFLLWALLYTALAGGVLAIIVAVYHRILKDSVRNVFFCLYERFALQTPMDMANGNPKAKFPYVIAILCGTAVAFIKLQPWQG